MTYVFAMSMMKEVRVELEAEDPEEARQEAIRRLHSGDPSDRSSVDITEAWVTQDVYLAERAGASDFNAEKDSILHLEK